MKNGNDSVSGKTTDEQNIWRKDMIFVPDIEGENGTDNGETKSKA